VDGLGELPQRPKIPAFPAQARRSHQAEAQHRRSTISGRADLLFQALSENGHGSGSCGLWPTDTPARGPSERGREKLRHGTIEGILLGTVDAGATTAGSGMRSLELERRAVVRRPARIRASWTPTGAPIPSSWFRGQVWLACAKGGEPGDPGRVHDLRMHMRRGFSPRRRRPPSLQAATRRHGRVRNPALPEHPD